MLEQFLAMYPPDAGCIPLDRSLVDALAPSVTPEVLALWEHGVGMYGNGLLQVVDPIKYEPAIYPYIMRDEKKRYVPLILTAFGSLYYLRQLNNPNTPMYPHDITLLDPQTGNAKHILFEVDEFFSDHLQKDSTRQNELQLDAFQKAMDAGVPPPKRDQMLCHTPMRALGGDGDPTRCTLGDALVHWDMLRQF